MVALVLDGPGQEPLGGDCVARAIKIRVGRGDLVGAGHRNRDVGKAQAALLVALLAFGFGKLGIEHDQRHGDGGIVGGARRFLRCGGHVDHADRLLTADLFSRQSDAAGDPHRLEHVRDKLADFRRDLGHGNRLLPQERLAIAYDLLNHPYSIPGTPASGCQGCECSRPPGGRQGLNGRRFVPRFVPPDLCCQRGGHRV